MRDQALEVSSLAGVNEAQNFCVTSLETLCLMVKAGTGITLIPEITIEEICIGFDKQKRNKATLKKIFTILLLESLGPNVVLV